MTGDQLNEAVKDWEKSYHRSSRRSWIIVGVIWAIFMAVGVGAFMYVDNNQKAGKERGVATRARVSSLETNYQRLYDQFLRCKDKKPDTTGCTAPVTPDLENISPKVTVNEGDTTVIRQVETLPPSEVRAAVTSACGGSCKGKDVTVAMVKQAIVDNCGGSCKGADGQSVKGDTGDPPSDAQVQAAVATYCSENNCKGDPGPFCPDGYTAGVLEVLTSLTESTELFACIANDSP